MITALIVDGENKARETLIHMLSAYCPTIKVIGEANGVASGYKQIIDLNPDVVFLDIVMHDGTGFELLKKFERIDFYFIIITTHHEFAIQSFKVNALDYLLKPIDSTDLINAIAKLTKMVNSDDKISKINTPPSNLEKGNDDSKKIVLKTLEGVFVVHSDDVVRCESQNNCTLFYFKDGSRILISKTLKEFDEVLTPISFIRCHQSHLVNMKHIIKYSRFPNPTLVLSDNSRVPVSVRKREAIERIQKKQLD
ncbi:MAG: response regulator [Bacteroidales bacterium]|nr:MAG: response regulator [Bacteroidales bacterium]